MSWRVELGGSSFLVLRVFLGWLVDVVVLLRRMSEGSRVLVGFFWVVHWRRVFLLCELRLEWFNADVLYVDLVYCFDEATSVECAVEFYEGVSGAGAIGVNDVGCRVIRECPFGECGGVDDAVDVDRGGCVVLWCCSSCSGVGWLCITGWGRWDGDWGWREMLAGRRWDQGRWWGVGLLVGWEWE